MSKIIKIAIVLSLIVPLGGCATLVGAGIGALVTASVVSGAGGYVGGEAAKSGMEALRRWKHCSTLPKIERAKCRVQLREEYQKKYANH